MLYSLKNISLVWTCLVVASSAFLSSYSTTPIPPSQDTFYIAPAGFEHTLPGTILRLRPAPGNMTSVVSNSSAAYNILYRTTNSLYKPWWAVTTLFVPSSPATSNSSSHASYRNGNGSALLSYQIPYNTADVDYSPSYALYSELQPLPDIPTALGRGWYVNVPDFEGPLASFGAGVEEGHATLDSIRAVLSSGLGLAPDARLAMWGYSGGSVATEWAAELQVEYAPELNFSGMAVGGLVPNFTSLLSTDPGTIWAAQLPLTLLGLTSQYPQAYAYLVSQLKTSGLYNATGFLAAKKFSFDQAFEAFSYQNIWDYFVDGIKVVESPLIQAILNSNAYMGYHGVPSMPIFAYKAIHDEISPVGDTDALVDRYCGIGANILYQRNTIGGHLAEETNGDPRAFAWLSSVLDGSYSTKYSPQGCTIENVSVNITSSTL